jgi:two-component system phosphate regulon response regulator PhoB
MAEMDTEKPKAHILVVEDDRDLQGLFFDILGKNGYRVEQAFDGRAGLEAALAEPPDLVLLDIMLPELDGRDVLVELKKHEATREVPVIIISARGSQADRRVALELGADDYLDKPFSTRMLLSRLAYKLEKP